MDREQEVIHHQMEETRADLADKLSALEQQVSGTVQTATQAVETTKEAVTGTVEAVTGTVETVKETVESVTEKLHETVEGVTDTVQNAVEGVKESVQETFQSVAETLNLKLQAERHPWAVFGGSVAAGALAGYLLGGSSRRSRMGRRSLPAYQSPTEVRTEQSTTGAQSQHGGGVGSAVTGLVSSALGGWLGEQLSGLKGLAIGAMMGVVRDLVKQALPEGLKDRVSEEVDKITRNLGGEPLQESLISEQQPEQQRDQGHEQHHSHDAGMGGTERPAGRAGQPSMAGSRR